MVTGVAAGRATLTARNGSVEQTLPVQVIGNTIASLELTPDRAEGRTGDVIRFKVTARDRNGGEITGLTPTWSFSPGNGSVDADGAFVGYEAGSYLVTASFGTRSVDAVVTLEPRDVRRPLTVRRPGAAHPLHHRGSLGHPERQGRLPRLGQRR